MRSAVFASFFHAASTDEEPHHNHCPIGRNSWCFFQRALAKGEEPGYHRDKVGTPLAKDVAEKVKEVYVRLGHPDLLDRCLQGKTQNANESLHSKVWLKCPKTGFVGLMRVCAATCLAIAEFNQGFGSTVTRSYAIMGLQCGSRLKVSAAEADSRRLRESVRQVQASTKGCSNNGSRCLHLCVLGILLCSSDLYICSSELYICSSELYICSSKLYLYELWTGVLFSRRFSVWYIYCDKLLSL